LLLQTVFGKTHRFATIHTLKTTDRRQTDTHCSISAAKNTTATTHRQLPTWPDRTIVCQRCN